MIAQGITDRHGVLNGGDIPKGQTGPYVSVPKILRDAQKRCKFNLLFLRSHSGSYLSTTFYMLITVPFRQGCPCSSTTSTQKGGSENHYGAIKSVGECF